MKKGLSVFLSLLLCLSLFAAPARAETASVYGLTRIAMTGAFSVDFPSRKIEIAPALLEELGFSADAQPDIDDLLALLYEELELDVYAMFSITAYTITLYDDGTGQFDFNGDNWAFSWRKTSDAALQLDTYSVSLSGNQITLNEGGILMTFTLISQGDSKQSGFVNINGTLALLQNGQLVTDANGLIADPATGNWYYCSGGYVLTSLTQLVLYNGAWFYVSNGKLDTVKAGIVSYDGGRFFVAAGRILTEVNGLIMDPDGSGWYYCAAGQVQTQYTGLAQYDGAWFYVINGRLADTFVGDVPYDGAVFHVVGGQVV